MTSDPTTYYGLDLDSFSLDRVAHRGAHSNKELLLAGQTLRSGALAWRQALRVGIMLLQQNSRVVTAGTRCSDAQRSVRRNGASLPANSISPASSFPI